MAYYPNYAVLLDEFQKPQIHVRSCFESDDILKLEVSLSDGVPSLTIYVESCIPGVPAAEWVFIDVRPVFMADIEENGLVIFDLATSASFLFSEIVAGRVTESSIYTDRVA